MFHTFSRKVMGVSLPWLQQGEPHPPWVPQEAGSGRCCADNCCASMEAPPDCASLNWTVLHLCVFSCMCRGITLSRGHLSRFGVQAKHASQA